MTPMSWMDPFDSAALRRDTERALRLPVGLASPFWLAFGAAASAGVAWWWMSRMGRPINLEAKMGSPRLPAAEPNAIATQVATPDLAQDDLTTLKGVGPKLAAALKDLGVTRFAHIAAWTATDLAEMDAALNLRGRASRDDWVGQAKILAA
jgi:predicted flap endonuclease-1-like 5' DNA nuclease